MVSVQFSKCSLCLITVQIFVLTAATLVSGISATEKYSKHDKNWWFWNLEAKEKPATLDESRKKGEREIHKLEFKRAVLPFKPNIYPLRSLFTNESITHHKGKKRWLSGSFPLCGKKKQYKASQKWLIDSQRSGYDPSQIPLIIQDPRIMPQKKMRISEGPKVDVPFRQIQARPKVKSRKNSYSNRIVPVQHRHAEANEDIILFRHFNHDHKESDVYHTEHAARFSDRQNTDLRPMPTSVFQRSWNKSRDPIYDRYKIPFEELKVNPLKEPYPFHDPRSTIRWYTTPQYRTERTSEPPLFDQVQIDQLNVKVQQDRNPADCENDNVGVMERKLVAKFKDKKYNETSQIERSHGEYNLIPKIYALSHLRNRENSEKKPNDQYGWLSDATANPIIVPGFKRKHSEDPDNARESLQPYIFRAEEQKVPCDDECIQHSRANRNQTKNFVSINENKVSTGGVPVQVPSPYAFPGGVNISILVPNPPAPSHESPLSTTTPTSTEKNVKKKKGRKKKMKNDDESFAGLLSEPRSLASARKTFLYVDKTGVNPLIGNDDRRMSGIQRTNFMPRTTNKIDRPILDLKADNFSLLSHIRNLTLKQLDLDTPLFGIKTEKSRKSSEDSDKGEDDEDEIRMLYDEQSSSTTTLRSDEKLPYGQTVSFSWFRLTDYTHKSPVFCDFGSSTPSSNRPKPSFVFGGSGSMTPRVRKGGYLSMKRDSSDSFQILSSCRPFRRSVKRGNNQEREVIYSRASNFRQRGFNFRNNRELNELTDQWDILDQDLKKGMGEKSSDVSWEARNRKRDIGYNDHQTDDEQGYYKLSVGVNSFRHPTNFLMSALGAKSNKHREREYYDDIPDDERIREQIRPNDRNPSNYPK